MSRIRSTHPGLWTDERFVAVSAFARLFFMGLWNECDDQGAFEWSPLKLKMRLLPADPVDTGQLLDELEQAGCLLRYDVDGRAFGAVRNFCRYQRPKKPNALFPLTDAARDFVALDARMLRNNAEAVADLFGTGGEIAPQREEEGGKRESVPAEAETCRTADFSSDSCETLPARPAIAKGRGTRLDADFALPVSWSGWAASRRGWSAAEIADEALLFANYWQSKAGRDGAKLDWFKTWQNWVLVSRRADGSPASAPRQLPREEQVARLEVSADWFERHDRPHDAVDCRARAAGIRARTGSDPPRTAAAALPAAVRKLGELGKLGNEVQPDRERHHG
jgi:hypothetical protein